MAGKAVGVQSITDKGGGTYLMKLPVGLPVGTYLPRERPGAGK